MRCEPPTRSPDRFTLTATSTAGETIEVIAPFEVGTWDCAPPAQGGNDLTLFFAGQNDLARVRLSDSIGVTVRPVAGAACSITVTRAAGRAVEGSVSMTYRLPDNRQIPLTASFRDDAVSVRRSLIGTLEGGACTATALSHQVAAGTLAITATGITCDGSAQPDLVVTLPEGADNSCGGADGDLQLIGPSVQASTSFGAGSCTAEIVERNDDQVIVRFPSVVLCATAGCLAFEDVGITYALR